MKKKQIDFKPKEGSVVMHFCYKGKYYGLGFNFSKEEGIGVKKGFKYLANAMLGKLTELMGKRECQN